MPAARERSGHIFMSIGRARRAWCPRFSCRLDTMYTELDLFLLDAAKGYVRSLSDEQFLALTCDLTNLHDELIRMVHQQSINRKFRAPYKVTADVFLCSKDNIKYFINKKGKILPRCQI